MRVVYTNGCFDLLHAGHVAFLKWAAMQGDYLIVGLNTDESIARIKGKSRPILPYAQREAMLLALRWVNEVVPLDDDDAIHQMCDLKPAVYVKGKGYTRENLPEWRVAELVNIEVRIAPFLAFGNVSTSEIERRIKECPQSESPSSGT